MEEYKKSYEQWKKNQERQIELIETNIDYNKKMIEIHSAQLEGNKKALETEKGLLRAGERQYKQYQKGE